MIENEIAKEIVDVAFKLHTTYGPGLLESVYERSWLTNYESAAWVCIANKRYQWFMKRFEWSLDFAQISLLKAKS